MVIQIASICGCSAFEMGDALTWMNKRRKQEKHVIKQCKIHNTKSQGARWSFCTPTNCQTDKTETENYHLHSK